MNGNRIATPDSYAAVLKTFGDINTFIRKDGTLSPTWEASRIVRIALPAPLRYLNTPVMVSKVTAHKLIADVASEAFREIHSAGKWGALENYGGGFSFRPVRNRPDKLSLHSFGIAYDFDVYDNPLGKSDPRSMDPVIVEIFSRHGFMWGGRYQGRKDQMHFQYATNC